MLRISSQLRSNLLRELRNALHSRPTSWQTPSRHVHNKLHHSRIARRPSTTYPSSQVVRLNKKPRNISQAAYYSSQSSWPSPVKRPTPSSRKITVTRDGYTHFGSGTGQHPNIATTTIGRYIIGFSAAGIGIYIYASIDQAPFTGRTRLLGVSRRYEMALGKQTYDQLLQMFEGRILPYNHRDSVRVRNIVFTIASTVERINPKLSEGFEWQVVVAAEDEPNALCVPGGRILITTGLLKILPTDNDIAVVLGHEIAHALNRHGAESMHLQRLLVPIVFIANQILDMRWLPTIIATLFLRLPYARKLEHEADDVGLLLCAEACYDPRVAPGVFKRLGQITDRSSGNAVGDRLAPFLSTHPQSKEREKRLRDSVPARMERYNDKCVQPSMFVDFVRETQLDDFPQLR